MESQQQNADNQIIEEEKPGEHLLICPSTGLLKYGEKVEVNEANENQYSIWSRKKVFEIKNQSEPRVKETLNAIFPPKTWEKEGRKYFQYISFDPITRDEDKVLYNEFIAKLKERKARESGICPIREEIYSELFDELIRQVSIECPERGLLLLKVRDELKNSLASYQILYDSALLFGIRKQVQAEKGKIRSEKKLEELRKKRMELINRKVELENEKASLMRLIEERNKNETQKKKDDLTFLEDQERELQKISEQLRQKLEEGNS